MERSRAGLKQIAFNGGNERARELSNIDQKPWKQQRKQINNQVLLLFK